MAGFAASRKKRSAEPAHDSRTESTTTSDPSSSHQRPPKRQAPSPAPNSPPARDLPGLPDNQIRDLLPIVPTSATTSPSNYGRINAENESNLVLLESMPNEVNHYRQRILRKMSGQISTASGGEHHDATFAGMPMSVQFLALPLGLSSTLRHTITTIYLWVCTVDFYAADSSILWCVYASLIAIIHQPWLSYSRSLIL